MSADADPRPPSEGLATRTLIVLLIAMAALFWIPCKLRAQAPSTETMIFAFQPPRQPVAVFGNSWTIFATGQIDSSAASRFKRGLAERSIPPNSLVYFNSPGGNLLGGVELGRVIREAGLLTYIGRKNPTDDILALPGVCLSACSIAFLGGHFRYVVQGSVYGVHRFSFSDKMGDTTDVSQILSAIIVAYIREMGAQSGLFSLMTEAGKDAIRILQPEELKSFMVTKDSAGRAIWSLESVSGHLYLKGQRITEWGPDKILIYCDEGRLVLGGIFGDRGNANAVTGMRYGSIFLGQELIQIPEERMRGPSARNGAIDVSFLLTPGEVQRLTRATSVGIAVQFAYDAPTFAGISAIELNEGREKMSGLLASCQGVQKPGETRRSRGTAQDTQNPMRSRQ